MNAPTTQAPGEQRAAPRQQMILAQTRAELNMTLRRGESVLVTIIIPALLLIFAMAVNIQPPNGQKPIDFFVPGILAVAVMSTGMVSLSIATAYERYYGVLKRLGSSPLPRWGLLAAKTLSILALEAAQIIFLLALAAILYGWRPQGSFFAALFVLLLGNDHLRRARPADGRGVARGGDASRRQRAVSHLPAHRRDDPAGGATAGLHAATRAASATRRFLRRPARRALATGRTDGQSPRARRLGGDLPGRGGAHLPLGVAASRAEDVA